jgi:hypothetical protein
MSCMVDPKLKWKAMSSLASILISNDMTIFGSFVSTQILHNDHASKFYELRDSALLYADPACRPDLGGRLLIPGDIDVLCTSANYKKIMMFLDNRFFVRRVKKIDMTYLKWMCATGDFYLYRNEIAMLVDGEFVVTAVDFVVQYKDGALNLPNLVDADVNGLMLSSAGVKVHSSVRDFYPRYGVDTLFVKVIHNILSRRCIVRSAIETDDDVWGRVPARRLKKLRDKGYTIGFKYEQVHFICSEESSGECIVCFQEFSGSQCKLAGCDCNCRFCSACLISAVTGETITKCPMCRTDIDMTLAKIDVAVFNEFNTHTPASVYLTPMKHR